MDFCIWSKKLSTFLSFRDLGVMLLFHMIWNRLSI